MPQDQQDPPFAIQIELVEGCNLRCSFCGINGIRTKRREYRYMDRRLAVYLAHEIARTGWNPRVEFAMHGEPSLYPMRDLWVVLKAFRKAMPKGHLMMTSNGIGFTSDPEKSIPQVMRWINVLALDEYEGISFVPRIVDKYPGKVHRYPEDPRANPHRRRKPSEHDVVIVQDIEQAAKGTHSLINNHCGCGAPKNNDQMGKRCAKPFRELSIRWNGWVALCCNDWRGYYRCGDAEMEPLDVIWNGRPFRAARKRLYRGLRDFGPCAGCDAVSYRLGLLPDKYGKTELPKPTAFDDKAIEAALADGPLTEPVFRPYEVE